MIVKEINITNFRNLKNTKVHLSPSLNIFKGENAQGKTNLLETLYICAIGKSPRLNKIKDCITWGKNFSIIKIVVLKKFSQVEIDFRILDNNKKIILINKVPIKSLSDLLGELKIVYFFPEDLKLIKESPADRRKFMDIDLSQTSKSYFVHLKKYNLILAERNKLLKQCKTIDAVNQTINIWNEQLAVSASEIIFERIKFLEKLSPLVMNAHREISGNEQVLNISYVGECGETKDEIKSKLLQLYNQTLEKDFSLGYTTIGPHKDDIKIDLDGIDIRIFGSQGQQRTASLALKFAEINLFEKEFGEPPILLLDDVLSELDESRQNHLIQMSKKCQTILTCTNLIKTDNDFNIFNIKQGEITKI